ncbi:MAG: Uma2 family endonuclease [Janthinobacterium lividum]
METLDAIKSEYELERGKPMPSKIHGRLQAKLVGLLYVSCGRTHTIYSELSITLAPHYARQVPDVAIYDGLMPYPAVDEISMSEVPLIAVEILSPTQALTELTDKIGGYLAAGVKSCWLLLPGLRSVAISTVPGVYQTFDYPDTLRDPATGIELELAALFS